jgi:hypothetical protein
MPRGHSLLHDNPAFHGPDSLVKCRALGVGARAPWRTRPRCEDRVKIPSQISLFPFRFTSMGVEHLANSISLAIADSASGSSPPDYGNFLNQLPRYLPPIIGGVGAFIPLLLFSAFSDCFKKSSALIFSTLGIQIWFAYFVTVKAGAALGYTELLTFVFLPVALLFLLSLLWYSTKFPPTTRHFLKVVYTLYSGALLCLTIATTNFFGFGSLQIYILRVLPKDAKSVEETYQTEVRTANQLDTKEEREKAIKDADAQKKKWFDLQGYPKNGTRK